MRRTRHPLSLPVSSFFPRQEGCRTRAFRGLLGWVAFLALGWGLGPSLAQAQGDRLAVLVGNQTGWKDDPTLRYVLEGDLRPMASILRGLGFTVRLLENKDSQTLRQTLRWVEDQAKKNPRIKTFLFYYTGHADREVFHLGPKETSPFSYKEFVTFLRKLPVLRRFAILDACFSGEVVRLFGSLAQMQALVQKGVRRLQPLDLSQTFASQNDEEGLQIMTSSLDAAWESSRYRASIFTHFLLQGIRGPADRDNDGTISIEELFAYASQAMEKETRQKPYFFGFVQRAKAYPLAPAYSSRLWIGPAVTGTLRISVANFFWSKTKKQKEAIRLALIPGQGVVEWKKQGRCLRQAITLAKGQEVRLQEAWEAVPCKTQRLSRKGRVQLPSSQVQLSPSDDGHQFDISGGLHQTRLLGSALLGGGQIGWRYRWFGLHLGVWGTSQDFQETPYHHLFLHLQGEVGYRLLASSFDLFVGVTLGYGVLLQDFNREARIGGLFSYGLSASFGVWITESIGLHLRATAGFQVAPIGQDWHNLFAWQALFGFTYRFGSPPAVFTTTESSL